MEKQSLENIGQFAAYGIIILGALIKGITSSYSLIKDMFKKNEEEEEETKQDINTVNVTVGSTQQQQILNPDSKFLLLILLEHSVLLKEVHDLKPDTLKDQLDYYRKFAQRIKLAVTDIMIDLLKDVGIDDIHFGTYFSNFENFIEMCEDNVKMEFTRMCEENHFSEQTPSDFRKLVDSNLILLEGIINNLLRKRYPQKEFIKNFNRIYKLKPDIHFGFIDCLEVARDIAVEKEHKVKVLREKFEKKISELTGEDYKT